MSFTPGQIVAQDATNFRALGTLHRGRIHPEIYRALSTSEHLAIVDQVDEDGGVWVYHVDKKPDGWDKPSEGRVLRRVKFPAAELRSWPIQPADPLRAWTRAREACERDERPQYLPGIFDCQIWVYQCAELLEPTPSQKAKAELAARGVNYMEQAMRVYGGKALGMLSSIYPARPS
jgi:hypothetical protein